MSHVLNQHLLRLLALALASPKALSQLVLDEGLLGHLPEVDVNEEYDGIARRVKEELDMLLLTTPEELEDAEYELRVRRETEGPDGPYPPFKTGSEVWTFLELGGFTKAVARYKAWEHDRNKALNTAVVQAMGTRGGVPARMLEAGLPEKWVADLSAAARTWPGINDLMDAWDSAENDEDRDGAIEVMQDLLNDLERPIISHTTNSCEELKAEGERLRAYKDGLRVMVEAGGGISAVAERAGMPRPSLNRLLTSGAWPTQGAVAQLALGLGVDVDALYPDDELELDSEEDVADAETTS